MTTMEKRLTAAGYKVWEKETMRRIYINNYSKFITVDGFVMNDIDFGNTNKYKQRECNMIAQGNGKVYYNCEDDKFYFNAQSDSAELLMKSVIKKIREEFSKEETVATVEETTETVEAEQAQTTETVDVVALVEAKRSEIIEALKQANRKSWKDGTKDYTVILHKNGDVTLHTQKTKETFKNIDVEANTAIKIKNFEGVPASFAKVTLINRAKRKAIKAGLSARIEEKDEQAVIAEMIELDVENYKYDRILEAVKTRVASL